jgi:hypothetical protein
MSAEILAPVQSIDGVDGEQSTDLHCSRQKRESGAKVVKLRARKITAAKALTCVVLSWAGPASRVGQQIFLAPPFDRD